MEYPTEDDEIAVNRLSNRKKIAHPQLVLSEEMNIISSIPLREQSPSQSSNRKSGIAETKLSPASTTTAGEELSPTQMREREKSSKSMKSYSSVVPTVDTNESSNAFSESNTSPIIVYNRPPASKKELEERLAAKMYPTEMDEGKLPYHEPMPDLLLGMNKDKKEDSATRVKGDLERAPTRVQNGTPRPLHAIMDEGGDDMYPTEKRSRRQSNFTVSSVKTPNYYYCIDDKGNRTYYLETEEEDEEDEEDEVPLDVQLYRKTVNTTDVNGASPNTAAKQRTSLYKLHDKPPADHRAVTRPLLPLLVDDVDDFYNTVEIPEALRSVMSSEAGSPKVFYTFEDDGTRSYFVKGDEDEEDEERPLEAEIYKNHRKQRASLYKLHGKNSTSKKSSITSPVVVTTVRRTSDRMGNSPTAEPAVKVAGTGAAAQAEYLRRQSQFMAELREEQVPSQRNSIYSRAADSTSVNEQNIPKRGSAYFAGIDAEQLAAEMEEKRRCSEYLTESREEQQAKQRESVYSRAADVATVGNHSIPKRYSTQTSGTEAEETAAEMDMLRRQTQFMAGSEAELQAKQRDSIYSRAADTAILAERPVTKRDSVPFSEMTTEQRAAEMEERRRRSEYMTELREDQLPLQRESIYSRPADVASVGSHQMPKRYSTYSRGAEAEEAAAEMDMLRRQTQAMMPTPEAQLQSKQRESIYSRPVDVTNAGTHQIPKRYSTYTPGTEAEETAAEMDLLRRQSEFMAGSEAEILAKQRDSIYSRAADTAIQAEQPVAKRDSIPFSEMTAEQRAAEMEERRRRSEYITGLREEKQAKQRESVYSRATDVASAGNRSIPKRYSTYTPGTEAEEMAAEMDILRRQTQFMAGSEAELQAKQRDSIYSRAADTAIQAERPVDKRDSVFFSEMTAEQRAAEMEERRRRSEYITGLREEQPPKHRESVYSRATDVANGGNRPIPKRYSTHTPSTEAEEIAKEMELLRRQSEFMATPEAELRMKQRDSIYSRAADTAIQAERPVAKRDSVFFSEMTAEQRAAEMEERRRRSEYMFGSVEEIKAAEKDDVNAAISDYEAGRTRLIQKRYSTRYEEMDAEQLAAEMEARRRQSRYIMYPEEEILMVENDINVPQSDIAVAQMRNVEKRPSVYYPEMTAEQRAAEMEERRRQSKYIFVPEAEYESRLNDLRAEEAMQSNLPAPAIAKRYSVHAQATDAEQESMEAEQRRRESQYLGGKVRAESDRQELILRSRHASMAQEGVDPVVPVVMTVRQRELLKRPPLLALESNQDTAPVDYNRRRSQALGPDADYDADEDYYRTNIPEVIPYFQDGNVPPSEWVGAKGVDYRDTQTDDYSQTPQPIPMKKPPAKRSGSKKKKAQGGKYPPLPHAKKGNGKRSPQNSPPPRGHVGKGDAYWAFVSSTPPPAPSGNRYPSNNARLASTYSGGGGGSSNAYYNSIRDPGASGTLANLTTRSATPLGKYSDSPYLQNRPRRLLSSAPPVHTDRGFEASNDGYSNSYSVAATPSMAPYNIVPPRDGSKGKSSHYINGSYRYCDLQTGKMMLHQPGVPVDKELSEYNTIQFHRVSDRRIM